MLNEVKPTPNKKRKEVVSVLNTRAAMALKTLLIRYLANTFENLLRKYCELGHVTEQVLAHCTLVCTIVITSQNIL